MNGRRCGVASSVILNESWSISGLCGMVFCFKQKTAYEMRMSDWSSDVCSSDLNRSSRMLAIVVSPDALLVCQPREMIGLPIKEDIPRISLEIGRASCRERVCQYV